MGSVFATRFLEVNGATDVDIHGELLVKNAAADAGLFTLSLLGILIVHELGHYVAARIQRVDASLPYFLPLPVLSPFGTMGAVIRMRGVIPTRKALFDIGAAGPLAGLALAIPLYVWGISHSPIVAFNVESGQLGESLLTRSIDHFAAPAIAEGQDIWLHPVAYGAWGGFLITMINLLPVGQLDAGHVAYALFGPRQNRIAVIVHRAVLVFFFVSLVGYTVQDLRAGLGLARFGNHVTNSLFWLVWFEMLAILGTLTQAQQAAAAGTAPEEGKLSVRTRAGATLGIAVMAGVLRGFSAPLVAWIAWLASVGFLLAMEVKWGALRPHSMLDHPPTSAARLGWFRAALAVFTLCFFALLFMPAPFIF